MANVIITFKIMPTSPDITLREIENKALAEIKAFAGEGDTKIEHQPVAFGIVALMITFISDEAKGSTDELEAKIREMDGVNSCEVVDVRRAVG